jgi:hypothetical protein
MMTFRMINILQRDKSESRAAKIVRAGLEGSDLSDRCVARFAVRTTNTICSDVIQGQSLACHVGQKGGGGRRDPGRPS